MMPSFPKFSALADELRIMIWEAAIQPRIVHVRYEALTRRPCIRVWSNVPVGDEAFFQAIDPFEKEDDSIVPISFDERVPKPKAKTVFKVRNGPEPCSILRARDTPALLLACRESFTVAKRHYVLTFGLKGRLPNVWFNFGLDALYLTSLDATCFVSREDATKTRRLAVVIDKDERLDRASILSARYDHADVHARFHHLDSYTTAVKYFDDGDEGEVTALGAAGLMRRAEGLARDPFWEDIVERHFPGAHNHHIGRGLVSSPTSYAVTLTQEYHRPARWSKIYTTRPRSLNFLKAKKRYERNQIRQVRRQTPNKPIPALSTTYLHTYDQYVLREKAAGSQTSLFGSRTLRGHRQWQSEDDNATDSDAESEMSI